MIDPPRWPREQLLIDLEKSVNHFRYERLQEPLEDYLQWFDTYQGSFEDLLETTTDLLRVTETAGEVLVDSRLLQAFRYVAGPPISQDDLIVVSETSSLSPSSFRRDNSAVARVAEIILTVLDRRRFPWVTEGREPTETERKLAVLASAALMATQKVGTDRRNMGKSQQEARVRDALLSIGFVEAPRRDVQTVGQAPAIGEFCGESVLGNRKADFIIHLWDDRLMPVECKVSNSSINSVKRLNNDAAIKAEVWRDDFGRRAVVPAAVLSGVYKLHNLEDAQNRNLTLFWAHDLASMASWIESTRTSG